MRPLDEVLKERRLTMAEAISAMRAICRGLARAHQQGQVHGHLWPHLVLVATGLNEAEITGFDSSRTLGLSSTLSTSTLSLGAFRYLAPEQTGMQPGGPPPDHRADLYSAGVIFQEMLTGRPPGDRVTLPSHVNSELPPEADVLVLKCLARNPAERYATASDLLTDLARLEEASRLRLLSELRGIAQAGSGRKPMIAVVIAIVLLILAVVAFFLMKR